jgi:malate dehydrogenase (oxaloacetate-decarboxylating)
MTSNRRRRRPQEHQELVVAPTATGRDLLENPLKNKGSAFTDEERRRYGLLGLLPPHVSTADEQLARAYENFKRKDTDLERYIFLVSLQDRNESLFYMLHNRHIREMMPVIYTPVVGEGCRHYSHIYRRPRGLYLPYTHASDLDAMLANSPCPNPAVIVVTDGERILGLGDLGIGGMGIPIGKLSLYTLCAGIHPATTLPIVLDVGTNNEELLRDPLYLGWRHPRVVGADYDRFIESFVTAVMRRFPQALLQWEDFSKSHAAPLLARYRDRLCTFNDDIQGTGAVTLAGLLSAMRVVQPGGARLSDQRVVILGAGSSAIGISDQIVAAMVHEGTDPHAAREAIWLVDSEGLVHTARTNLGLSKLRYAQRYDRVAGWPLSTPPQITLYDVVHFVRPTILIGTSAQSGAFTERIVRLMAGSVKRPVIFPLSNPTSKSEAVPADLLTWTDGRALIATGSPFPDVNLNGRLFHIGQCNNAFVFPGIGLGVIASGARRVTDGMFVAAARALSAHPVADPNDDALLYPPIEAAREIARDVAMAVGLEAQRAGVAEETTRGELAERVLRTMWTPGYESLPAISGLRRAG